MGKKKDSTEKLSSFLSPIFDNLSNEALKELTNSAILIKYNAGDLIVQEGAPFSGIYIIHKGLVRIGKYSSTEKRRTLRFLATGEFYGLEVLFLERHRTNIQFARAILDSELIFFHDHVLKKLIINHPNIMTTICRWFAREVAMLEFKLTRDSTEGSLSNVALLLSALKKKYGKTTKSGILIDLELPRKLMAEMLGMSEDTVQTTLKKLKDRQIISVSGSKFLIHDKTELGKLAPADDFYLTILQETL